MTQPKYLGLIAGQMTIQGPNGPFTITPHQGQGVAAYLIEPWEERAHDYLPTLGLAAPVAQAVAADPTAQVAANLIGHLQAALSDDGRVSMAEAAQLAQDIASHPSLADVLKKSVSKLVGLVR